MHSPNSNKTSKFAQAFIKIAKGPKARKTKDKTMTSVEPSMCSTIDCKHIGFPQEEARPSTNDKLDLVSVELDLAWPLDSRVFRYLVFRSDNSRRLAPSSTEARRIKVSWLCDTFGEISKGELVF